MLIQSGREKRERKKIDRLRRDVVLFHLWMYDDSSFYGKHVFISLTQMRHHNLAHTKPSEALLLLDTIEIWYYFGDPAIGIYINPIVVLEHGNILSLSVNNLYQYNRTDNTYHILFCDWY